MNDLRIAAQQALEKIGEAHAKVSALCRGDECWTMSVPVRPDYDHDVVISDALCAASEALHAALAQQAEPVQAKFDEVAAEQWKLRMVFYDENGEPLISRQPEPDEIRAALAQQAEPVEDEANNLYWRLHGLSKALESSGRIDELDIPDAYATLLDAMAAVLRPQAHDDTKEQP